MWDLHLPFSLPKNMDNWSMNCVGLDILCVGPNVIVSVRRYKYLDIILGFDTMSCHVMNHLSPKPNLLGESR